MFKTRPVASSTTSVVHHRTRRAQGAKSGTDYNFFPFPDIDPLYTGAVEVPATSSACSDTLKRVADEVLVTAPAQNIWVKAGALSANKNATSYPDDIAKRSAELLTNAKIFAFDASDLMPVAMNNAFWKAILDYTKDPSKLDSILAELDKVQVGAYKPS